MGIDGLMKFIKENVGEIIDNVPFSVFAGKSVAIDISIRLCANRSKAYNSALAKVDIVATMGEVDIDAIDANTISSVCADVLSLLKYNIRPIVIFDGEAPELKHNYAHIRREKTKMQALTNLQQVMADIVAEPTYDEKCNHYTKFMAALKRCCIAKFDKKSVEGEIKRKLTEKGVTCLVANGEADMLCASLFMEGKIAAVISTDTDMIPRGCTTLITRSTYESGLKIATTLNFDHYALSVLGITRAQFIELCIAGGCDYNKNIEGVRLDTAYKYIKEYGSLEAWSKATDTDISCLNIDECKQLFQYAPSASLIAEGTLTPLYVPPEPITVKLTGVEIEEQIKEEADFVMREIDEAIKKSMKPKPIDVVDEETVDEDVCEDAVCM